MSMDEKQVKIEDKLDALRSKRNDSIAVNTVASIVCCNCKVLKRHIKLDDGTWKCLDCGAIAHVVEVTYTYDSNM